MPPILQKQLSEIDQKVSDSENERKNILRTIEVIKNTFPYKRFIMTGNFLVTLDDNKFRDNPNIFAFKYGGNITVVGYITNIINSKEDEQFDNDFAPMYKIVNTLMLTTLFKNKAEIYIIHPIAIYYE